MKKKLFVCYYRVSTQKQGMQGYGMDAQKTAVQTFLNGGDWEVVGEFAEVESGKNNARPELQKALALCRQTGATLVIAKLDRLGRNAAFLLNLQDSGIRFVCADQPQANEMTIGILAVVAQEERKMISQRTKAGLAAAKQQGVKLGNPKLSDARKHAVEARQRKAEAYARKLAPAVNGIRKSKAGKSLRGIAQMLHWQEHTTPNGKKFCAQSVKDLLAIMHRLGLDKSPKPSKI